MIILFKALLTGFIAGALFTLVDLPLPAPGVFAGIVGIFGIWLGYVVITFFKH